MDKKEQLQSLLDSLSPEQIEELQSLLQKSSVTSRDTKKKKRRGKRRRKRLFLNIVELNSFTFGGIASTPRASGLYAKSSISSSWHTALISKCLFTHGDY